MTTTTTENPLVFITLFGKDIHWYGVMFAGAFLIAVLHWTWLARRTKREAGFGSDLGVWLMIFGVIGARLMYAILNWKEVTGGEQGLLGILRVDQGGLVFYGGFIGGVISVFVMVWFYRKRPFELGGTTYNRETIWTLGDFIITAVPLGHALGRIGCFLHGCCYGHLWTGTCAMNQYTVTPLPGGSFDVSTTSRFPIQLVEALGLLAIYFVLVWFYRRNRTPGRVFALYLVLYGLLRFSDEFGRGDFREPFMGINAINIAQGISLTAIAVGISLWFLLSRLTRGYLKKSATESASA